MNDFSGYIGPKMDYLDHIEEFQKQFVMNNLDPPIEMIVGRKLFFQIIHEVLSGGRMVVLEEIKDIEDINVIVLNLFRKITIRKITIRKEE